MIKKTVLITGGSRGIGLECVKIFAHNNYNVIINYKNSDKNAEEIKNELEHLYQIKVLLCKCLKK